MVIKSETNFLYQRCGCLPQVLLNLRHFNAEVTLDHTNSYYLKKLDETFLKCREVLVLRFTLELAKVMHNVFPSV